MHFPKQAKQIHFLLHIILGRSFFQSVCVLGYCLAPVAGALIVCKILLVVEQTKFLFFLRLLTTFVGFQWATYGEYDATCLLFSLNLHIFSFFSCIHIPWR